MINAQLGPPLDWAVSRGNEKLVRLLVEAGADPNLTKKYGRAAGWTALRCAIKEAKEDVALNLLESGSKFEGNDFISAAEAGMEKVIKFMIDAGIDVDFQTEDEVLLISGADRDLKKKYGWTALRGAIKRAKEGVALILLESGSKFEGNDFISATNAGMEKVIKFMIDAGIEVNFQTEDGGSTALGAAARAGRESIVTLLLRSGAKPDPILQVRQQSREVISISSGLDLDLKWQPTSPLRIASSGGDLKIMRLLIEAGADPNLKSGDEAMTALQQAVLCGKYAAVELLLRSGAQPSALAEAALKGHEELMSLLLSNGAATDSDDGRKALKAAARKGCEAIFQTLLDADVSPTCLATDSQVIYSAVVGGHNKIVQRLLRFGCSASAVDEGNNTLLHLAVITGNRILVDLLLELGADANALNAQGDSALMLAVMIASSTVPTSGYRYLSAVLTEDSSKRWCGQSHIPSIEVFNGISQALLRHGANVNVQKVWDQYEPYTTALQIALSSKNEEIAMFLLDSGAKVLGNRIRCDMNYGNNSGTEIETSSTQSPYIDRGVELRQAIKAGFSSIVPRLLSLGADTNAREPSLERGAHDIAQIGQTPLLIAVSSGNKEVVQQLLDHGADVNAKTEDHETRMPWMNRGRIPKELRAAIHYAALAGRQDIVELLRRNGADDGGLPLLELRNLIRCWGWPESVDHDDDY